MSKIKLLAISLLALLLMPFGFVAAQEEESTTVVDDSVIYETQDYDYYLQAQDNDMNLNPGYYPSDGTDIGDSYGEIEDAIAILLGNLVLFGVFGLPFYIFSSIAMSKVAKELGHENPWFAWVPVLNMIQLFQLGGFNPLLLLLLFVPVIGQFAVIIISIIAQANIYAKRGYDKLLILVSLFIPFGVVVLLYLIAWKPKSVVETTTPVQPTV